MVTDRATMRRVMVVFGVLVILGTALSARADIFMFIDSDGVIHFTNTPTSSNYKHYMKEKDSRPSRVVTTDRYDHFISVAADTYEVSFPLVKAVIKAESDFDPHAVSHAGAMGLMQVMPDNFKKLNISNPFDPWENIMGGTWYLRQMMDRFEGELSLALAAYNAGPEPVERYKAIPPYKETQQYVNRVLRYYRHLKQEMARAGS